MKAAAVPLERASGPNPRWWFRGLATLVFLIVIGGMAVSERGTQANSRSDLAKRFAVRGSTAAAFVQSYTESALERERALAETRLSSDTIADGDFQDFLAVFGFGPAVLLDATGHALDVAPYRTALIGTEIGSNYAHLKRALQGLATASNVVPSAVSGVPIVALATPFDTPFGRRVVSGAYDLSTQPLGIYMKHVLPYATGVAYLVDSTNQVIAGSVTASGHLEAVDPGLARAIARYPSGTYASTTGGSDRFATAAVGGTPWRLIITVPAAVIYGPISSDDRLLPWLFLAAFALAGGVLLAIFVRNRESKMHATLDARTDALTGIANRRSIEESLDRLVRDRRRNRKDLGVLMIDVDHFKAVNDRLGHNGGDIVLREVVERIRTCLRADDEIGRWGGEEFVVLLPDADIEGIGVVAERILANVGDLPMTMKRGSTIVTVSIGGTITSATDDPEVVVNRADLALYSAKDSGRDRYVMA